MFLGGIDMVKGKKDKSKKALRQLLFDLAIVLIISIVILVTAIVLVS